MKKLLNICALPLLAGLQSCNFTGQEPSNGNQQVTNPGETPEKPADELVMLFTNDLHSQIEPLDAASTYNAGSDFYLYYYRKIAFSLFLKIIM